VIDVFGLVASGAVDAHYAPQSMTAGREEDRGQGGLLPGGHGWHIYRSGNVSRDFPRDFHPAYQAQYKPKN